VALRLVGAAAAVVLGAALVLAASRSSERVQPPVEEAATPVVGPKIAAAGDVACDPEHSSFDERRGDELTCRQYATSELLVDADYEAVLVLGDIQYEEGEASAFAQSYDPTWGRAKGSTRPVPGNHEYRTRGASGYFAYFGAAAGDPAEGYYSYDVGAWHVVALNSNCDAVGGCGEGSAQEVWLRADLAASSGRCTLAYWHHPRYSSGTNGSDRATSAFWQALHDAGAEVVLAGHDHDYERFAPQDARGGRDEARGIRQFVVGTGGRSLRTFPRVEPNSEVRDRSSFGVLELTLGANAYAWRFRPAVGSFTDSGSARCH
jgi:hypothetical protein